MSWKASILSGVLVGSVLSLVVFGMLCKIGVELMVEQMYVSHTLPLEPGCGLEPVAVCASLDYLYYESLLVNTLDVVVADGTSLQPFVAAQEDEVTAVHIAQPVDYRAPQVTLHGMLIQGSK